MNDMFRRMDWCGTSVFDNYCHHLISLKCPLALGPSLSYHQFGPWPNRACAVLLPHDESLGCDGDSCRSLHKFLNEGRPKIRINPDNPACFAGLFCSWFRNSSLENIEKHWKKTFHNNYHTTRSFRVIEELWPWRQRMARACPLRWMESTAVWVLCVLLY